ncbi:hypothetical protein M514_03137 [Trichuris suis]|uniref:Uncharacterized protein n=1 Tax=Trichuris suis TaxID=68888 RepID=A0A085MFL7_9BILA|nr:hypothetical protein M513_03137 [Trichuris suis]KFD68232.1 hypothetical protein M514_03137 [Trichuris suis]KHJ43157.1 hypothetical protein D918_06723 [Trichuris suis]
MEFPAKLVYNPQHMDKFTLRSIGLSLAYIFAFFLNTRSFCYRIAAPVSSPYQQNVNSPNAVGNQYGAPTSQLSPYMAGVRQLPSGYGGFPYPLQELQIKHDKMVMQNIAPDQYGRGPDIPLVFLPPRPPPPETNYVVSQPSVPLAQSQGLSAYQGHPQDSGLKSLPYKKRTAAAKML